MAREIKENTEHKHMFKRGIIWWVTTMRDGKRTIISTKETELKKARFVRDELLKPYDLRDEKKRVEAMLSRVQTVAQQLTKIEDGVKATTIKHGWQAYQNQNNRPDSGPVTLRIYEGWFEAFARWIEVRHPEITELRQVTTEHAGAYASYLLERVSATTFNRHVFLLTLVWRILEKPARLLINPWKSIERKRFAVHSRRELTIEELQKVCETAQGEMRLLVALGTFCGLRLGDAACLEWGCVDMLKGIISLVPQKTARRSQKRVIIPIHRTLYNLLVEIPTKLRKGYVMPTTVARYRSFNGALAKDVARLFQSCGIQTTATVVGSKRNRADCGFHSLRHTFVSLCAAGGVSQSVVQSLVGHGSPAMTQHYTHIGLETAQRAVASLPDVIQAKGLPEAANATEAETEALQRTLVRMTLSQLQVLAAKVKALIGTLETAGKTKAV
ncbi:MAG: tyrosine-type recombinase/integrase [bacterium]